MNCPTCGIENRESVNFCRECRADLGDSSIRSHSVRPITTLIAADSAPRQESLACDSPIYRLISTYDSVFEPLEIGSTLNSQYEVTRILPSLKNLSCYQVRTLSEAVKWCGQCGHKTTNVDSPFCNHCGYDLSDNHYLLLEGDKHSTNGIKKVLMTHINHEGILQFFERFHFNGRYYAVAQLCDGKTLDAPPESFNAFTLINWCMVLGSALEKLHKLGLYQPDFSLTDIFLRVDGPKLVNFSRCKYIANRHEIRKKANRMRKKDMKALAKTFQKLVAKNEVLKSRWGSKEGLMSVFKEILNKAVRDEFRSIGAFLKELDQIKNYTVSPPLRKKSGTTAKLLMDAPNGTKIIIGKGSDRGVRRSLNEDSVGIYEYTCIFESVHSPIGLCIIADGMGGHKNGEVASRIAIQTISEKINEALFSSSFEGNGSHHDDNALKEIVENAVFEASDKIHTIARAKQSDMGATIAAALIINNKAFIINVGDSRIYHLSQDGFHLVSEDHSMVYRLYKVGQIKYDDIYTHPQRNQILRCLGESALRKNLVAMASNANHGYFYTRKLQKGDQLLLCSDGLWEMISDNRLEAILKNGSHPQEVCDELIQVANNNGGEDNISVSLVKIE